MSFTAAQLKTDITDLSDLLKALSASLENIPDDEKVAVDALELAATFVPGLTLVDDLIPLAEFLINLMIANNTQGQPGSETPMHGSGGRGDNPGGEIVDDDD